MGGEGSGVTRKSRRLPRKRRDGAIARLDGRAPEVRVVRDGVEAIVADQGGADHVSFLTRRAAHRCLHLDALLMRDELAMTTGQPVDVALYLSGATTWLRYAQALGFRRRARPALSLADILRESDEQPDEVEPAAEPEAPSAPSCEAVAGYGKLGPVDAVTDQNGPP